MKNITVVQHWIISASTVIGHTPNTVNFIIYITQILT